MRIGAVLLYKDGLCWQSYGWSRFRPLGSIDLALKYLENYLCDEVSIIRPVRSNCSSRALIKDIDSIKFLKTMTPISFGGGVRDFNDIEDLKDMPIERLIFSSAFLDKNTRFLNKAINTFGRQAIQALIPFKYIDGQMYVFNSSSSKYVHQKDIDFSYINEHSNEIILYDVINEGKKNVFDFNILEENIFPSHKLIISGGIGKNSITKAKKYNLASVLIDNNVLHNEFSIKDYKNA